MAPAPTCTTSSLDWAGLIFTIIAINVSWWLADIPLLWKHGFRQYLDSVTWQCLRLYMPSLAALYALTLAQTPHEQAFIYYTGPFYDALNRDRPAASRGLTIIQLAKALVLDLFSIISTILTVASAIQVPADADTSGINSSIWAYPSLPVAIIGLWILFCSRLTWSRAWTIWLGLLVIIIVGVALALPLALLSPGAKEGGFWIAAVVGYGFMALPFTFMNNAPVVLICTALGLVFRVGGIGLGALSELAYFPFCQLKGQPFAITYITVGAIGAALAIWGRIKFQHKMEMVLQAQVQQMQQRRPQERHIPN
jgi:hypothetical protein